VADDVVSARASISTSRPGHQERTVNLLLAPFSQMPESFVAFVASTAAVALMIWIVVKAALSAEGGRRWVKAITNVNMKFLFTFLFIGWLVSFGILLQLVPHVGASSPYGAIGLIALFSGFFVMMGLLWAVIGE
jgi:hypothetical protein